MTGFSQATLTTALLSCAVLVSCADAPVTQPDTITPPESDLSQFENRIRDALAQPTPAILVAPAIVIPVIADVPAPTILVTGTVPFPSTYYTFPSDRGLWQTLSTAQQQRALLFLANGSTIEESLKVN